MGKQRKRFSQNSPCLYNWTVIDCWKFKEGENKTTLHLPYICWIWSKMCNRSPSHRSEKLIRDCLETTKFCVFFQNLVLQLLRHRSAPSMITTTNVQFGNFCGKSYRLKLYVVSCFFSTSTTFDCNSLRCFLNLKYRCLFYYYVSRIDRISNYYPPLNISIETFKDDRSLNWTRLYLYIGHF